MFGFVPVSGIYIPAEYVIKKIFSAISGSIADSLKVPLWVDGQRPCAALLARVGLLMRGSPFLNGGGSKTNRIGKRRDGYEGNQ